MNTKHSKSTSLQ